MNHRVLVSFFTALVLLCCITACKHKRGKITQSNSLYTSQHYSDYTVDSSFVSEQLDKDTALQPLAEDILAFYQRRNYEAAWLNGDTLTLSAHDFLNTLSNYESVFGDSSVDAGFDRADINSLVLLNPSNVRSMLDLKLTATFFRYAARAYGGTSDDVKDLEWYIPRMKKDYQRLIDTLVISPSSYSIYEPVNAYYRSLKTVLIRYRHIENNGGLPLVESTVQPLHRGDSAHAILQLKRSLRLTGDYMGHDTDMVYSDTCAAAVAHFQGRMGLRRTGIADSLTLAEINVPIAQRIRQIILNMERLRWMPDTMPDSHILVNIPEYRLHVSEHGRDTFSMDVVVGRAANATSIFAGRLSVVDFSPSWHVPVNIIKNEILPKLKTDPGYLAQNHMELLNRDEVVDPYTVNWHKYKQSIPYDIRQVPGPDCALGLVAFFFPNSFDIYLHDTPAKSLFSESDRAFSHGCIRLSEPEKLADYVFRNDSTMQPDHIRALMDAHIETKVSVRPAIPVYIVYFTAWVDEAGSMCFRHDIYGLDARLASEIFGK